MRKIRRNGELLYESPLVQTIKIESEQMLAASVMVDDMTESWGEWDNDLTSKN